MVMKSENEGFRVFWKSQILAKICLLRFSRCQDVRIIRIQVIGRHFT